jgi:magnesium transporter
MLKFHSTNVKGEIKLGPDATALPAEANWIDAMRPNHKEIAFLEQLLGIAVPTLEKLSEIETSSRLYRDKDQLFMSTPMIVRLTSGLAQTSPLGFVLTKDYLLTIRYAPMKPCETLHYADILQNGRPNDGPSALITLLERIIDHCSDELEKTNSELDLVSQTVFGQDVEKAQQGPVKYTRDLRKVLGAIARNGDLGSKIDDVLLGMSRMLPFLTAESESYLSPGGKAKIKSLSRDIGSLNEYRKSLTERTQFLLDATLGLTNIEQNNIFRLLTVVSVIGIPPTLVASLYGMNFKNMPELEWTYGYEWGLALILISAFIPVVWFKWRGWW